MKIKKQREQLVAALFWKNSFITKIKDMKIEIKKLSLTNFKGIRSLSISFDAVTNILGDNATGKTTLMDAFLWLLFGKDSSDRKDFEIKTLGPDNQPYHKLDHEVEAVLLVDGIETVLRRSFKEKWTKKRGSSDHEFTGHETSYFWNDVPMKQEEYQAKIAGMLDEKLFKLLTNTTYFNSMKWQDRRAVLLSIAGKIDDSEILQELFNANGTIGYQELITILKKKSVEEYKKEISAKKKKLKDELDLFPARIEEANRALPEEKDYSAIDELIASVTSDISSIDGMLQNKTKATKDHQTMVGNLLQRRQNLNRLMMDIEFSVRNDINKKKQDRDQRILAEKSELRKLTDDLAIARKDYTSAEARRNQLLNEQTGLREKWNAIDKETIEFKDGQFCCPTCKREYEASDVEQKKLELTNNFNANKSSRLNEVTKRGKEIGTEIGDLDLKLSNLKAAGEKLNLDIQSFNTRIANLEEENQRLTADEKGEFEKAIATHQQYQQYKVEVAGLTEQIDKPFEAEDNSALIQRKKVLNEQLTTLNKDLAGKDQRQKQLNRITELSDQESKMAQELASLEGIEFSIEQFIKAKMDTLEARINGRFKIVRFKMFEEQINGGQIEACTTLINGVPYSDANTAGKIQAGLDIINTLSDHYDVQAPVWVDNRESVVRLPETNCQLINLIVSEADKKLRIESAHQLQQVA